MTDPDAKGPANPIHVCIVVGEESGDRLGASLMVELAARLGAGVRFSGVGGEAMSGEGLESLFPLDDIAVMGLGPVIARLPTIIQRVRQCVAHVASEKPDLLVIIDSPDFTHAVAKRVRSRAPAVPVMGWVSPSVWAWRPGRAKVMAAYVDHLLALLPFEPDVHKQLGGPPCSYIGHPLIGRLAELRPGPAERRSLDAGRPVLLVLPGSRRSEIDRHLDDLRATVECLDADGVAFELVLPAVDRLAEELRQRTATWAHPPKVVSGEKERYAAFRQAHAALAVSGTVTLELALAGVPMVVIYRLDWLARRFRFLIKTWTIVLPNFVWGRPVIREYVGEYIRHVLLARAVAALLEETPERQAQVAAFEELDGLMATGDRSPAQQAADIALSLIDADSRASG